MKLLAAAAIAAVSAAELTEEELKRQTASSKAYMESGASRFNAADFEDSFMLPLYGLGKCPDSPFDKCPAPSTMDSQNLTYKCGTWTLTPTTGDVLTISSHCAPEYWCDVDVPNADGKFNIACSAINDAAAEEKNEADRKSYVDAFSKAVYDRFKATTIAGFKTEFLTGQQHAAQGLMLKCPDSDTVKCPGDVDKTITDHYANHGIAFKCGTLNVTPTTGDAEVLSPYCVQEFMCDQTLEFSDGKAGVSCSAIKTTLALVASAAAVASMTI